MSQQTPTTISPEVANQVLAHFSSGGYPAGAWHHKLIALMACADRANLDRLTAAFPEYGAAVDLAKYDVLGLDNLRHIARSGS